MAGKPPDLCSGSQTLDVSDLESNGSNTEISLKQLESTISLSDHPPSNRAVDFAYRVQRIRSYIEKESKRLLADEKRIDVNPSIRREIEAFRGNSCCRVRKRLYHLGLL